MIDIIKVEFFRLKKSKLFWAMLIVSAATPLLIILMSVFLAALVGSMENLPVQITDILHSMGITNSLLASMGSVSSDVALWCIIATAVVLSKEFVDGTMRNVILANKSRTQLYFAYLITSLIVAASYLTAFFAVTLIVAAPIFGFGDVSTGTAATACLCSYALGLIAIIFTETCVCMFVFAVRKQWAAILFPILIWFFAPTVFTVIVNLISTALSFQGNAVALEVIRWIPFVNMGEYDPTNIDGVIVGMNILYMAIFTAVFVVSGYYTFKKADLK
ncbi:MAG: ABC transporter permease [Clostridia bacterium]|nr:ABC transporter permease [Clostridia bacterium]